MTPVLDAATAAFAFVAALFWFLSAAGKLPPMVSYWDKAPDNDPFFKAVRRSAMLNRWGAVFAGLSALCAGASFVLRATGTT